MTDFEKIISNIIENKRPCVFISPHLDDAIFSAGGIILELARKTQVTIVTVFTEAGSPPNTLSAKKFLKISGYPEAQTDLFGIRRKEDTRACETAGVNFIHLGFTDAMWRKKEKIRLVGKLLNRIFPEINHLYPFYRFNVLSGRIAKGDLAIVRRIKDRLVSLIAGIGNAVIFCPVGAGNHVDHIITRNICAEIFPRAIFWTDFPYHLNFKPNNNFISKMSLSPFVWNKNLQRKKDLILGYKTQTKSITSLLCANSDNILKETFYITS